MYVYMYNVTGVFWVAPFYTYTYIYIYIHITDIV